MPRHPIRWLTIGVSGLMAMIMVTPMLIMGNTVAAIGGALSSGADNWFDWSTGSSSSCSTVVSAGDTDASTPGDVAPANTVASWTKRFGQAAFDVGKQYGIPYEVILGQSAIESGWGESSLAAKYFNYFGIKAVKGEQSVTMGTTEYGSGGSYQTSAGFAVFKDPADGFSGYGRFIHRNGIYRTALQYPGDPHQYIVELKNAGYATDPDYVNQVWGLTKQFQDYIQASKLFPPSSQVTPDVAPPDASAGTGTSTAQPAAGSCGSQTVQTGEVGKVGGAPTVAQSDFSWMCTQMKVCKAGDYGDIASGNWGYQCVWYAWTRLAMIHGYEGWTRVSGDGGQIWSNLQGKPGWTVDQTPHPGDGVSATHDQAPKFAGTTHVAVVEEVQDDPSGWKIRVSEGNMHHGSGAAPCYYQGTKGCWNSYQGSRWRTKAEIGGVHFFRNAAWKN